MERTDYEAQAQEFLDRFAFKLSAAFKGDRCPPWEEGNSHIHGDRYRVTIQRTKFGQNDYNSMIAEFGHPKSISFDFWNSMADMQNDKRPMAYDILACISGEAHSPTTADEVYEEYGDMKPSQANAIAKFAQRLQNFFTEAELEALAEIS